MKVENNAVQLGGLNSTQQTQTTKTGAHGAHHHHHVKDQVDLSPFAQAYTSDPSKVDQLTAAYQAGTYNVSPNKIAGSMISDATHA